MVLSREIAHQLVEQLAGVVEQSINIMDTSGRIIDSTDASRIGTLHGGARRILQENLKDLIIESDQEYEGAKNGINLPIVFDDSIVGVIGITGKTEEVAKYGQIIKKMTEILLLDNYVREQKTIEQKARDRFFDEWIFGRFDVKDRGEFQRRAEVLGIQPDKIRRVAVFSVWGACGAILDDGRLTEISRRARRAFADSGRAEMFRTSTQFICLFGAESTREIVSTMESLCLSIERDFHCRVSVGVDSGEAGVHLREGYDCAERAFQISKSTGRMLTVYDALDITQFVSFVPEKVRSEYLAKLFSGQSEEELSGWMEFLKAYYAHNGSIQGVAAALNMHKNTVQYKLGKLRTITGFDPRLLNAAAVYSIAIEFYHNLNTGE